MISCVKLYTPAIVCVFWAALYAAGLERTNFTVALLLISLGSGFVLAEGERKRLRRNRAC